MSGKKPDPAQVAADAAAEDAAPEGVTPDTISVEIPKEKLDKLMALLEDTPVPTEVAKEPSTVQVDARGQAVGVLSKYPVDKDYYPNPVQFLMSLAKLSRFNLAENYDLDWKVEGTTYETKWGTFINEPIFRLALFRKWFDEEGNLVPTKRVLVKRLTFTEDELLAKTIASDLGIDIEKVTLRQLLDQVRMKRMQQWMESIFSPRRSSIRPKTTKREVIGGQAYTVEEYEEEV
jgi:hypothetical protein